MGERQRNILQIKCTLKIIKYDISVQTKGHYERSGWNKILRCRIIIFTENNEWTWIIESFEGG